MNETPFFYLVVLFLFEIKLENKTGRHKEAPNMAEGNSVPTVEWSDGSHKESKYNK